MEINYFLDSWDLTTGALSQDQQTFCLASPIPTQESATDPVFTNPHASGVGCDCTESGQLDKLRTYRGRSRVTVRVLLHSRHEVQPHMPHKSSQTFVAIEHDVANGVYLRGIRLMAREWRSARA